MKNLKFYLKSALEQLVTDKRAAMIIILTFSIAFMSIMILSKTMILTTDELSEVLKSKRSYNITDIFDTKGKGIKDIYNTLLKDKSLPGIKQISGRSYTFGEETDFNAYIRI